MLLFAEGFEDIHAMSLWRKWGFGSNWLLPAVDTTDEDAYSHAHIVSGADTSVYPPVPHSRSERALWMRTSGGSWIMSGIDNDFNWLDTMIPKSRTVYVGIGIRPLAVVRIRFYVVIKFLTQCRQDARITQRRTYQSGSNINHVGFSGTEVARCVMYFSGTSAVYTWSFEGLPTKSGVIDLGFNPLDGEFRYYQFGMTLWGNEEEPNSHAWVESRIGHRVRENRRCRIDNILTAVPNSSRSHFINGVGFGFSGELSIDDVYICNDEGDTNNDFLGDVRIKRMKPSFYGEKNDSQLFGFVGSRHEGVAVDFIHDQPMPDPVPNPELDPQFIPFADPREKHIIMNDEGDQQTFRMTSPNYGGADPHIFSIVHNVYCRAENQPTVPRSILIPCTRLGGTGHPLLSYNNPDRYIFHTSAWATDGWEWRQLFCDNPNAPTSTLGFRDPLWNPDIINNADFGFELAQWNNEDQRWVPTRLRHNIVHDEETCETLGMGELMHRGFEFFPEETLEWVDVPSSQRVFAAYESIMFTEEYAATRHGVKIAVSQLGVTDTFNEIYKQVIESIGLEVFSKMGFGEDLLGWLALADWNDGFWTEQINDVLENQETVIPIEAAFIGEDLTIETSYLWSGHELADEALDIIVSYIFSGHEFLSEYIWAVPFSNSGYGQLVEDGVVLVEDHFDGHWVQFDEFSFNLGETLYIEQWEFDPLLLWIGVKSGHKFFDDNPADPVETYRWWT